MNNELKHVGVLGMRWGRRSGSSESGSINFGRQHRRLGKAVATNKRDIADLRKHGYKEEAKGLAANSKAMERKMAKIRAKKMSDIKTGEWGTGKKVVVGTLVGMGTLALINNLSTIGYVIMKGSGVR